MTKLTVVETPEPTIDIENFRTIEPLAKYIDRIGAEQLNFRRFMVKIYKGNYYTERSLITISEDGTIRSSNENYEPTKEEAAAIKDIFTKINWPKAIGASNIDALIKMSKAKKENLFRFLNRGDNTIRFVQERRNNPDGTKSYLPWTFFNDGKWRCMEPDGLLPFWKPEKRISAKIMIHEGAKAAHHVDWMLNSKESAAEALRTTHPWAEALGEYEHWGMIGGALAPHRADYAELQSEKPTEVVYFCDNDWAGKKAVEGVSRHWNGSLKTVYLDNRWPLSWDLADKFSKAAGMSRLFGRTGRYIGPQLKNMLVPATFATELARSEATTGAGRPTILVRKAFMEEWYHCIKPEVFIHRDRPSLEFDMAGFNSFVAPFSHSDVTGRFLKKDIVNKAVNLCYDPSKPKGPLTAMDGSIIINTHVPTLIEAEAGDLGIWNDYIDFLVVDEKDRENTRRWIATLIARPSTRMHYGLLMISETQGVGKTTLAQNILMPLVGEQNVSFPTESDIVESVFNSWCAHKRLAIVNEIYAGHSTKAYDKLKSIITDTIITVNRKFQQTYELENWIHVFACSNSFRALKISDDDRRWFVPKIAEEKKPVSWWEEFHVWLLEENGLGKIKKWAIDYIAANGIVQPGEAAPWSSVKQEVIEATMSAGQLLIVGVLDHLKALALAKGQMVFVTDQQLIKYIRNKIYDGKMNDRLEKPLTIRKLARAKGWFVGETSTQARGFHTENGKAFCIFSDRRELNLTPEELIEEGRIPYPIEEFDQI